jgi:hypothetical protein
MARHRRCERLLEDLAKWVPIGDIWIMYQKGPATRDARLSLRIPRKLKKAIARWAARDRRTVADAVILMLEEVTRGDVAKHR